MKVLFVCRSNVGRSQMAMELYNLRHPGQAASAGIIVTEASQTVGDRIRTNGHQSEVLTVMQELGVDLSANRRLQLIEDMLEAYDRVVVLAEPAAIPDYLRKWPGVVVWDDIEDVQGKSTARAREIRDEIRQRIATL